MLKSSVRGYEMVRQIGVGGMGTVYEAVHTVTGQRAAVKVLLPCHAHHQTAVQRCMQEAKLLNRIEHPSIVRAFACGQLADGRIYMITEYLSGETLHERLKRQLGVLPVVEALWIVRQIAEALLCVHQLGYAHRDVKPANIFLASDPGAPNGERVKLLDFGLAKRLCSQPAAPQLTNPGMTSGTPGFMAPEQCLGREITPSTDVYALGAVLYQMVAGHEPFQGECPVELMRQHILATPRPVRELMPVLPEGLEGLIQAMLQRSPALRPSVPELLQRLSALEEWEAQDQTCVVARHSIFEPSPPEEGLATQILPSCRPRRRWPALAWSPRALFAALRGWARSWRSRLGWRVGPGEVQELPQRLLPQRARIDQADHGCVA